MGGERCMIMISVLYSERSQGKDSIRAPKQKIPQCTREQCFSTLFSESCNDTITCSYFFLRVPLHFAITLVLNS